VSIRWVFSHRLKGPSVAARLFDFLGKQRHDFLQVAYDTIIADLKDRRLGVFVYRDDDFGRAHAGLVLNGPEIPHAT